MNRIIKAAQFAREAHQGQTRKWGHSHIPYIVHPMRVAGLVAVHPDAEEDMVIAAWLHDVVEDTPVTGLEVRERFGPEVAKLVEWMTNISKGYPSLRRAKRKKMDREHLVRAPWAVKLVKLCDRIDNLQEMHDDPEKPDDFVKLYCGESLLLLEESLQGVDSDLQEQLGVLANKGLKED